VSFLAADAMKTMLFLEQEIFLITNLFWSVVWCLRIKFAPINEFLNSNRFEELFVYSLHHARKIVETNLIFLNITY
jgi:hypothetical protein